MQERIKGERESKCGGGGGGGLVVRGGGGVWHVSTVFCSFVPDQFDCFDLTLGN